MLPGSDDGVGGLGGVARAAPQQVQVALAAGVPQPRLAVGAQVVLAEQLGQPARATSGSAARAPAGSRRRGTGGVSRGVQPSSRDEVAAGGLRHERLVAVGVGGAGPQPWIVSSGLLGHRYSLPVPEPDAIAPARVRCRPPGGSATWRRSPLADLDLVVVGGGVTGAGVALDAAARGLSVALLERADLAAGTSRWSSKLVHGGLRYLAHGEIGLARESARERAVLMGRTAPHLVRPLPFLVPDVAGRDVTALAEVGRPRWATPCGCRCPAGAARCPRPGGCPRDDVARLTPGVRGGRRRRRLLGRAARGRRPAGRGAGPHRGGVRGARADRRRRSPRSTAAEVHAVVDEASRWCCARARW